MLVGSIFREWIESVILSNNQERVYIFLLFVNSKPLQSDDLQIFFLHTRAPKYIEASMHCCPKECFKQRFISCVTKLTEE
jgi:hypothetical protein